MTTSEQDAIIAPSILSGAQLTPDHVAELFLLVADLRKRVLDLEKRLDASSESPAATPPIATPPFSAPPETAALDLPSGIVTIFGRMLIAIAGAYVLRALTDWHVLPAPAGVGLGLVYSLIWLGVAARSLRAEKFAIAVNVSTSVLILAPLVWEATTRLKVLSPAMSAAVLALYAIAALAIAGTIASASAILLAMALIIATHDIFPFAASLLVIAAAHEIAACLGRKAGARTLAALSTSACVVLWTWAPSPTRALFCTQLALALTYLVSSAIQSIVRRRTLTFAEIAQTSIALLAGMGGAVWAFHTSRTIMYGLGIAALAGGIGCYTASFLLFERESKHNFRAWSAFGLLLILAGFALPFSRLGFWILCCASAAVGCWTALRFHLPTLALHGAVYYAIGSAVAGATGQPFFVFFGFGAAPREPWNPVLVLAAGLAAWAAIARLPGDHVRNRISSTAIAGLLLWIATGLLASLANSDTAGSIILIATAVALAWAGKRWSRQEFLWLVYGFMAIAAYKLAIRDFRDEHNIALVLSLLSYGGALILLPKLLAGTRGAGRV